MPVDRPAVASVFAQWVAMFSLPTPLFSFGANSCASSMTRYNTPSIESSSAVAKSMKNRCRPAGLEFLQVQDRKRQRAAGHQFADGFARRRMQRHVAVRSAQNHESKPGMLAVGAGRESPPVRFDGVEDANAVAFLDHLLDGELGGGRFAAAGLAQDGRVLRQRQLRDGGDDQPRVTSWPKHLSSVGIRPARTSGMSDNARSRLRAAIVPSIMLAPRTIISWPLATQSR